MWDLPKRLFHWLIMLVVGFSWYSAETGMMDWHYRSGIVAVALLAFRLIWGFAGGSTARFSHFLRSPQQVWRHVRGAAAPSAESGHIPPGHNPLGGYSVVAMLAVLLLQVASGLFAVDVDGLESGPLSYLISFDQGRIAAEIHEVTFAMVQALVVLHVLAILYYRVRGRRLLMPMISGRDPQIGADAAELRGGGLIPAVVVMFAASILAWWISAGAPL
ncbi:MAG: cytochrome b/b6 domain-containing protein [Novosphingobium sp.]